MEKLDLIRHKVEAQGSIYIDIPAESVDQIFALYLRNDLTQVPTTGIECLYFGTYYKKSNKGKMLQYYLEGVVLGNVECMHCLGHHYKNKSHAKMKYYFEMAIEKNFIPSMTQMYMLGGNLKYLSLMLTKYDKIRHLTPQHKNDLLDMLTNLEDIPKESYSDYCQWDFQFSHRDHVRQSILKMTGVFPTNYDHRYILQFYEVLAMSRASRLPKDIMLKIAGHLYT